MILKTNLIAHNVDEIMVPSNISLEYIDNQRIKLFYIKCSDANKLDEFQSPETCNFAKLSVYYIGRHHNFQDNTHLYVTVKVVAARLYMSTFTEMGKQEAIQYTLATSLFHLGNMDIVHTTYKLKDWHETR